MYFEEHEASRDEVVKACYAYHIEFNENQFAHNFPSKERDSRCSDCNRSREQVRWSDGHAFCQGRGSVTLLGDAWWRSDQTIDKITETLEREETNTFRLIEKAETNIPRLLAKIGMSGESLAILHHTHGYDPETVGSVISIPNEVMADYHVAMDAEKRRSRDAVVKNIVTVSLPQ